MGGKLEEIAKVAPFTGAWIEISDLKDKTLCFSSVAPFTGAWIEIDLENQIKSMKESSHPSRVRGLKS